MTEPNNKSAHNAAWREAIACGKPLYPIVEQAAEGAPERRAQTTIATELSRLRPDTAGMLGVSVPRKLRRRRLSEALRRFADCLDRACTANAESPFDVLQLDSKGALIHDRWAILDLNQ